jgi:hypothetical protein
MKDHGLVSLVLLVHDLLLFGSQLAAVVRTAYNLPERTHATQVRVDSG